MSYLSKEDLRVADIAVNGRKLIANVIYEAIRCKTYPTLPRNAEIIAFKVKKVYQCEFENANESFYIKHFASRKELLAWIYEHIMPIPEIRELNLSQKEFEAGIDVDDPGRGEIVFTSRYSKDPPMEDDFVDLDAFAGNLANNLIRENIEIGYNTF